MSKPSIFISYSRFDERLKDRLVDQLRVLERSGFYYIWSDDRIRPGVPWLDEIDQAMRRASAAILLVTSKFLISDFIQDNEVPLLLERHRAAGLAIFPVIARDCPWKRVDWLARMQVRPRSGKPVWRDGGRYVDQELTAIAEELATLFQQRQSPAPAAASPREERGGSAPDAPAWTEARIVEEAVGDALGAMPAVPRGGMPTLATMAGSISTAISYGAPLYNDGHRALCAAIYLRVARALETALSAGGSDTPQSAMPARGRMPPAASTPAAEPSPVHAFVRHELRSVIQAVPSVTAGNATDAAWRLRFAFDHVLQVIDVVKGMDSPGSARGECGAESAAALLRIVEHALQHAPVIYEGGLSRRQDWIRGVVALQAEAVRLVARILDRDFAGAPEEMGVLRVRLRQAADSGAEKPYEAAWMLHHNLLCLRQAVQRSIAG